ncbi:MAG TPA: hypothetical protein PLT07_03965 [Trueperaceae bacterium]|nr:hypothetical protein [Trueperaceae bacterium]
MIGVLIAVLVFAALLSLLLSPIEALGWWAGWYGEGLEHPHEQSVGPYRPIGKGKHPRQFVVYLDGIAKVGAPNYDDVQGLLDGLSEALPDTVILGDLMPYSVRNVSLLEEPLLGRFWRRMFQFKVEGRHTLLAFSINIRNLYQVLVAADPRYGRVYGRGEAQIILTSLLQAGYEPGSRVPITIVGYSGGVQIGLAAAPFLKRALDAPMAMVSLAGVMASEAGLNVLDRVYHLVGSSDPFPGLGHALFPGRWAIMRNSYWNRLKRTGRLVEVPMGPMTHNGAGGYLDHDAMFDGENHQARTIQVIAGILRDIAMPEAGRADVPEFPGERHTRPA